MSTKKDKPQKREFSLNEGTLKKIIEPSQIQEKKANLMSLSKAVDEEGKKEEEPKEEAKDSLEEELMKPDTEDVDVAAGVEAYADFSKKIQKMLMSKKHQEAIESQCEPMSVLNVLQDGEFRQEVPVVKDDFVVEFRSMSAEEDLSLKKIMSEFDSVSDRYFWDSYSLYQQAICLVAINGRKLPTHMDDKGKMDRDRLDKKLQYILTMPMQVTGIIGMHLYWFDLRVRKLFNIDTAFGELKNG